MKYCSKCGALLEEDSKFCVSCGVRLDDVEETAEETAEANQNPVIGINESAESLLSTMISKSGAMISKIKNEERTKKRKMNLIGLIVGTIIIIVGFIRIFTAGTSISSTSFGADFYTYAYQGIVAISEILAAIEVSLGWIIVAVGAAINVFSLHR